MLIFDYYKNELKTGDPVVYDGEVCIIESFELTAAGLFRASLLHKNGDKNIVYAVKSKLNWSFIGIVKVDSQLLILADDIQKQYNIPSTSNFKDKTPKGKNLTYDEVVQYFVKRLKTTRLSGYHCPKCQISITTIKGKIVLGFMWEKHFDRIYNIDGYNFMYDGKDLTKETAIITAAQNKIV